MKRRLFSVFYFFLTFLIFFVIQKPIFLLYNHSLYSDIKVSSILDIIVAGFSMDVSMACYLTAIPLLASILSVFYPHRNMLRFLNLYGLIMAVIVSVVYVIDMGLFSYWEFRLDSTPLFYFFSSPKSAFASGTIGEYILAMVFIALFTFALLITLERFSLILERWNFKCERKWSTTLWLILAGGLMFLGIRGGWTVSTMNTGRAYFSSNELLNQAAINPLFSFMESLLKSDKFGRQYQFYNKEEMDGYFNKLYERKAPEVEQKVVLSNKRPDIYLIVLESFSTALMESSVNGKEVTPFLNSLAKESVFFDNFYCNSFRTDRGLTAILSGYPSQPSTSIMKYPRKAAKLSGIGPMLKENGYDLNYYYGGDINFTNLKANLRSQGFDHIVADSDFPVTEQLSKWGVHDSFVYDKALRESLEKNSIKPHLTVIQSSSSHEPFDVPFDMFEEDKPNAFAYADSCLKSFVAGLRASEKWENSLIVIVPDHYGAYPEGLAKSDQMRYRIPLIWTGGAITEPQRIHTIGSQMDIAATLLGQLDIDSSTIPFSNNVLDTNAPHFAYFSYPGYIGLVNDSTAFAYSLVSDEVVWQYGNKANEFLNQGKALLQKVYKDIAAK